MVFTGGIGEKFQLYTIRDMILQHLDFLRPFEVRVIKTNDGDAHNVSS